MFKSFLNAMLATFVPMAHGADIDQAFINTYETNLRHLAQQKYSKLKGYCQYVGEQSESHNWETLASMQDGDVDRKADRTGGVGGAGDNRLKPTPNVNKPFAKRRTNIDTYDTGHSTEQEDISQMIIDPNSNLVLSQGMAMGRHCDDIVIGGMWKPASVKGAGAPVPFPLTQVLGDGTAPISFDFVTSITEAFLNNDIEAEEAKVIVIGPTQARKLLQITEATSADYTSAMVLQSQGIVNNWMGYTWIVSTRLGKYDPEYWGLDPVLDAPAAGAIFCVAMTARALGFHSSKDIWTRIAEDPSVSFAWRIYSALSADCVRVEDEHIFKLHLLDSL
jgi:hypothetical protein